ncbi:hypothetical protein AB6G19_16165 [Providencia manganoxydans]
MKKIIVILAVLWLSACGESQNITQLKAHIFHFDDSIKLGNALDSRKMCSNTDWVEMIDNRHREVVVYTCELTKFDSFYREFIDKDINNIDAAVQNNKDIIKAREAAIEQVTLSGNAMDTLAKKGILQAYNDLTTFREIDGKYQLGIIVTPDNYRFLQTGILYQVKGEDRLEDKQKVLDLQKTIINEFKRAGVKPDAYYSLGLASYDMFGRTTDNRNQIIARQISSLNDDIALSKKSLASLNDKKVALEKVKKGFADIEIKQVIMFSIDNEEPKPISCEFILTWGNEHYSVTPSNCFQMSYASVYTNGYRNMLFSLYQKIR